jgi:DNA helicase-2/ATP-dependent DNA helicase PcrA
MGDMSQGISSYRSIDNWQVLMKEVFSDVKSVYREVNHSYRSAREIVEFFNSVLPKGHSLAIPVYEIGYNPVLKQVATHQEGILSVIESVKEFKSRECKSIGIITKQESDSLFIYSALRKEQASIGSVNVITSETLTYEGGISIVPVTLAKGLEFDGVILWNASDKTFKDNNFDHKLLYVALSRALYYLHILYCGNVTPLLQKYT